MNFSWTDIDALEKPAFAFIFGPRFGKNITLKKPDRNIAMWIGGFRVNIGSATSGSLNAADLFPTDEWQDKVDNGYQKLQESQQKVDAWWNGLSSTEQKNPANVAKHEAANRALATFGNVLDGASQVVSQRRQCFRSILSRKKAERNVELYCGFAIPDQQELADQG